MNCEYIEGAKARARKEDFRPTTSDDWIQGYNYMHNILAPVEQEIVIAVFKYQQTSINAVRELEESFRDRGNASNAAGAPAGSAFPSERFAEPAKDGGNSGL